MIPLPTLDALDLVTIPTPCPVSWDAMHGYDRTRFCDLCRQNVHDVSELTRAEALQLLNAAETPCLRLYRRPDGRVLTTDCATRRERAWKWLDRRSPWAAALFALVFLGGCDGEPRFRGAAPAWRTTETEFVITQSATAVVAGLQPAADSR